MGKLTKLNLPFIFFSFCFLFLFCQSLYHFFTFSACWASWFFPSSSECLFVNGKGKKINGPSSPVRVSCVSPHQGWLSLSFSLFDPRALALFIQLLSHKVFDGRAPRQPSSLFHSSSLVWLVVAVWLATELDWWRMRAKNAGEGRNMGGVFHNSQTS